MLIDQPVFNVKLLQLLHFGKRFGVVKGDPFRCFKHLKEFSLLISCNDKQELYQLEMTRKRNTQNAMMNFSLQN